MLVVLRVWVCQWRVCVCACTANTGSSNIIKTIFVGEIERFSWRVYIYIIFSCGETCAQLYFVCGAQTYTYHMYSHRTLKLESTMYIYIYIYAIAIAFIYPKLITS